MLESRIISISIDHDWNDIYENVWRPQDFQKWASGLASSTLTQEGDTWKVEGAGEPVRIRFTGHNPFGVMDHHVSAGGRPEVYVPMRIIQNGDGAEVQLTLFRQPYMSDAAFAADADWVTRDLQALRALFTH
jgi:hypothetical protein